ncbi:MAG: Gfo/Idh/MocA family oxidoreductase [Spirochaetaceae bacterium]
MKKIVIIGASGHWLNAIEGLKVYPEAQIVAFAPAVSMEMEKVNETLKEHLSLNIPLYEDYETMLDEIKPDVAIINPYYYLNGPVTIQCLKRRIHCFTEKPLTFYRDELETIKKLVKEKNLKLSTMLGSRYHPAFYAAFRAVKDGLIGTPIQITAQKSYKSGLKPEWQHNRKQFGGIISWVGAHALDWINWVTDNGVKEIQAMENRNGNYGNGDMESSSIVLMRLNNGGQAAANIDYLRPSGAKNHGDDRLRIAGDKGVIEVMEDKAVIITADNNKEILPLEEKKEMFAEFLKYIDDDKCPYRQSLEDVYELTELCIRAQEEADNVYN